MSGPPPRRQPPAPEPKKIHHLPPEARSIVHHLQTYAAELGKDPETIKKALIRTDYRPKPGVPIPLKAIVAALFGEKYVEEVRALRLDNDERVRKGKERDGELVELGELEQALSETVILPLSSLLRDVPTTLDTRCNPEHPLIARAALLDWVEKTCKPMLRSKIQLKKEQ